MPEAALVPTVLDMPMDFTVVANSPKEMESAQRSLILWAARKIQAIKTEMAETQEQLHLHEKNKWNTAGWKKQLRRQENRAEFYRKIKAALEAGYYIVPPFPVDIFAIRTKKALPARKDSTYHDNHNQPAQILPVGEGRYVDPTPLKDTYVTQHKQHDGSTKAVTNYYATEYQEVDFPFKLARAEIRSLTDKAMSLKIFDRFGALPRTRSPDPIICGQIMLPDKKAWTWDGGEYVNFFVAWWLDTKTL